MGTAVLGGGVTGLAAGRASGCPVYEASEGPGGICASYYLSSDGSARARRPIGDDSYRFELGGGHWLFGGDPSTLELIESLAPCRRYDRRASVELGPPHGRVAYPIQHHLAQLGPATAATALAEISSDQVHDTDPSASTMQSWLRAHFGPTLCELFFDPFHERYTAGLYGTIAPQDPGKSPIDHEAVLAGASGAAVRSGYNQEFLYPDEGLDALVHALADQTDVRYGRKVVRIDTEGHELHFADGSTTSYTNLLSSLPLSTAVALAGVDLVHEPDPHTSVLVVNVGAVPGPALGDEHWVYEPRSRTGFHRYGVYSNVDEHFLPRHARSAGGRPATHASLYIERVYPGGDRPAPADEAAVAEAMVRELQEREVLGGVDVIDPTWIDVAYTWSLPGSIWRDEAIAALAALDIHQIGRYGRWHFQGIAASIQEGLTAGAALRKAIGPT